MSEETTNPSSQSNLCNRFKRTINIRESIDGDRYSYRYHSLRGDDPTLPNMSKTPENTIESQNGKADIDKHYTSGRLYGSYFSLVAQPPNKIVPVQLHVNKAEDPKIKQTKSDQLFISQPAVDESKKSHGRVSSATSVPETRTPPARQDQTQRKPHKVKLKFNYRSRGKVERRNTQEDEGSDVSSLEEVELEYEGQCPDKIQTASPDIIKNLFGSRKLPEFAKYIPVQVPPPLQVTKLAFHNMYPQEWKDAQTALDHDQASKAGSSNSDTQINSKKKKTGSGKRLGRISRLFPRRSTASIKLSRTPLSCRGRSASSGLRHHQSVTTTTPDTRSPSLAGRSSSGAKRHSSMPASSRSNLASAQAAESEAMPESVDVSPKLRAYRRPAYYPHPCDARFDDSLNRHLIEANTKSDPNFSATLYAQMPERPNMELCHIQTEMAVAAMLNFFHPYNNVQCYWISDIGEKLMELLKDRSLRPKFSSLMHLRRFDAILVLSSDAGNLLRHRNTCFLHSLACALHLSPHKLLVLARNPWMAVRPSTAPK